jgi:subtilisin family serine protease
VEPPAKRFGRFMMLHESGASTAPVQAVFNALPRSLVSRVARTMPVFIERESQLKLVATEQILVRFNPRSSASSRRKLLDGLELKLAGRSEFDGERHVVVPASVRRASRALDLANQLVEADDIVAFAAPNFLAEVRKRSVDDRLFGDQWHLDNTGQNGAKAMQDVRAIAAWDRIGGGDRAIVIAIIDDGIDLDHPDLTDNLWKNPKAGARDRHGRDFSDDADPFNPRPKVFNPPFDDTDTNDIHGTSCAGVAAAVGDNARGVAGIAWGCRLMAVKIFAGPALIPQDRIADAIRYASRHADVLSCSWGTARHPDIESAIDFAVTKGRRGRGSVVCVATGNEYSRRIGFPSTHESAIAVGACNDRGRRSKYSNYGKGIDIVAPSSDDRRPGITTTDVHFAGKGYSSGAYCDDFGGTSSATPLVAGVAALVLSANRSLTSEAVYDVLTSTADKIDVKRGGYTRGYSVKYGYGRVNADAAVAAAQERPRRRKRAGRKKR